MHGTTDLDLTVLNFVCRVSWHAYSDLCCLLHFASFLQEDSSLQLPGLLTRRAHVEGISSFVILIPIRA